VYALGAVAYECLTGRKPIDGESSVQIALNQLRATPEPLPPHVPAEIRALVQRAMAKDPNRRFCDGAALHEAVEEVLETRSTGPVRRAATAVLDLPPPAGRPPSSGRAAGLRALLGAAVGLVVLLVAGLLLQRDPGPSAAGGAPTATTVPADLTDAPPVPLVGAEHIGRQVADVQADLVGRGLLVLLAPVESRAAAPGEVTALTPEGALPRGSVVTVFYAVEPRRG
jgi:serine/threonine-protein kinase